MTFFPGLISFIGSYWIFRVVVRHGHHKMERKICSRKMVLQFLLHQQMFHRDTILSVINLAPKMIHPEYIQPM